MSSAHDGLNLGSWWYGALKLQAGLSRWRYRQLLLPHRALVPDEVNYHPEVVEPQIDDSSGRIVYRRTEFDPVRVLQARSDLDIDPSLVLFHELGDPGTRMAVSDDTQMNLLRGLSHPVRLSSRYSAGKAVSVTQAQNTFRLCAASAGHFLASAANTPSDSAIALTGGVPATSRP